MRLPVATSITEFRRAVARPRVRYGESRVRDCRYMLYVFAGGWAEGEEGGEGSTRQIREPITFGWEGSSEEEGEGV